MAFAHPKAFVFYLHHHYHHLHHQHHMHHLNHNQNHHLLDYMYLLNNHHRYLHLYLNIHFHCYHWNRSIVVAKDHPLAKKANSLTVADIAQYHVLFLLLRIQVCRQAMIMAEYEAGSMLMGTIQ